MSVRFICKECHNAFTMTRFRGHLCSQCFHKALAANRQSHPLPTLEGMPMLTQHDQNRVIELSDAAGRANNNGLPDLADKLSKQADRLLSEGEGQSFQDFGASRGLNMERLHGKDQHFASKHTQELFDCWLAARGQKVWRPPLTK